MKNQTSHQNRQPIRHSTTPPRIFIAIQYLEIGGAERSLIGLLNTLDYLRCQVDLFVYRHSGEFMSLIPKEVNLLPEVKKYTTLTRPIREIICEGYWDIAAGRITAHLLDWRYRKRTKAKESQAIFQYVANCTTPFLPSINENWTYDLAISFLTPHNIVRDKVKAQQNGHGFIPTIPSLASIPDGNCRYGKLSTVSSPFPNQFPKVSFQNFLH